MMDENALHQMRPPAACDCELLQERVGALESRLEDMEMILAGLLPLPRRRSGGVISSLRSLLHRGVVAPRSTIGKGLIPKAG